MNHRPTQADVAKAAGVHRTTVSLAFSNHHSIPVATKERIQKCAEKLGYTPDPMLSALAAYRTRNRPQAFHGTIAWLTNDILGAGSWMDTRPYLEYYKGALSCAEAHGYQLETFDLQHSASTPDHLASILQARNVQGILLPPQLKPDTEIDFLWDNFSVITLGHSLSSPRLNRVSSTQFQATCQTMRHLKELGYKRIGFVFSSLHDNKTAHNYLAGYLVESLSSNKQEMIPPFFDKQIGTKEFIQWKKKYRIDAIITGNKRAPAELKALGIRVPDELGVACPLILEKNSTLAGIFEDCVYIGEFAMNCLVEQIHRSERGIPEHPKQLLIEGTWRPGNTLRTKPE